MSQYRGIICLLFKKGDRDDLTNWRPITLLNNDYKLIAIIYANRLRKILPSLINEDQRAYIEGRQMTESIRLTQDIFDFADLDNKPGAIIFLDQQKAYDRVEWGYLKLCLEAFGFGPKFTNWILMLYSGGSSCILTNGFLSNFFSISRSMRQGCPIASYLYILQAEPVAQTIRNNVNINGFKLPARNNEGEIEIKISMFADDTQTYHSSEASIVESFKIFEQYCKASGAKLNLHKTEAIYIGSWKNKTPEFKQIKWVNTVIGLGTTFGHNINYEEIWMKKFTKFKKQIEKWKRRDLTLKGKKIIINSYIMSVTSFLTEIYTHHIPSIYIKRTKELICDFIWSGKTWRISQKNLALRKEHGGLEIQDIDNFIMCKKIKWILRIIGNDIVKWNTYANYCLTSLDAKYHTISFLLQCSNLNLAGLHIP